MVLYAIIGYCYLSHYKYQCYQRGILPFNGSFLKGFGMAVICGPISLLQYVICFLTVLGKTIIQFIKIVYTEIGFGIYMFWEQYKDREFYKYVQTLVRKYHL